jgi:DNA polymerase delta subunit 1
MNKLSIFQNMLEMSNATAVPVEFLITRGQQIKVLSLILKKSRSLGFVCPDFERAPALDAGAATEKYEGATVLDAEKGAYLEDVVSALDFASLYPSIMRAHNFCPSTFVLDARYANVPGVEYYVVETPQGSYTFAQGVQSVVPALLDDLALFRKEAKKKMAEAKAAGNSFQAAVENGRQLAFKISMNSAYGFWGATSGFFGGRGIPIAASVTTTGRNMIATTKRLVEELVPGSRVVYGDTVSLYI